MSKMIMAPIALSALATISGSSGPILPISSWVLYSIIRPYPLARVSPPYISVRTGSL